MSVSPACPVEGLYRSNAAPRLPASGLPKDLTEGSLGNPTFTDDSLFPTADLLESTWRFTAEQGRRSSEHQPVASPRTGLTHHLVSIFTTTIITTTQRQPKGLSGLFVSQPSFIVHGHLLPSTFLCQQLVIATRTSGHHGCDYQFHVAPTNFSPTASRSDRLQHQVPHTARYSLTCFRHQHIVESTVD